MAKARRVSSRAGLLQRIVRKILLAALLGYVCVVSSMVALRWVDPITTGVQVQRRIESWGDPGTYRKRYTFVPLSRISPHVPHAVIAAEDGHFFQHHGFDWGQIREAVEEKLEDGRLRGASTITQQLVKNLYLTTHTSFVRKGIEATLVPPAEMILGKRRILELYLNVIEWGPGVYGAEAASQYHYGISASRLDREQAARLAAILPSPRRRKPARMNQYTAIIMQRMSQLGW